ncbi:hypothetical protein FQN54_007155 [Arachnomyces sp. PD_36]|nr:hypothetical protein FQN54_007155 [Arachnomyces sp. PD_36]
MDIAYDHIQEDLLSNDNNRSNQPGSADQSTSESAEASSQKQSDLSTEFQETFRAFSASPWGARLGGIWGNVRKQGESYYEGARQEYSAASEEAVKGLTDLRETIVGRTRGLSLGGLMRDEEEGSSSAQEAGEGSGNAKGQEGDNDDHDSEGLISRFRLEAAKRLKDIEKAEDAADEALLRFGTNIRNFLRDAVSIAPPDEEAEGSGASNKVLFESKDADGKRVIHTTRFEAQLHVIHSSLESFSKDPVSDQWPKWKDEFKIDDSTDNIAADLEAYPELRRAMEQLVPEKVDYADFWCRYYFLRLVIETEEKKRKELLKGVSTEEEEVAWDEDSDSESDSPSTPQVKSNSKVDQTTPSTLKLPPSDNNSLKPGESRASNDLNSQADSDASYDLVSGATSRAPGSPKEKDQSAASTGKTLDVNVEDSDEEDWE